MFKIQCRYNPSLFPLRLKIDFSHLECQPTLSDVKDKLFYLDFSENKEKEVIQKYNIL